MSNCTAQVTKRTASAQPGRGEEEGEAGKKLYLEADELVVLPCP